MSKKAISPLIGAVLIIGFTVALAAVVMFWSSGFIKSTTTTTGEKVTEQVTLLRDLELKVREATVNLTESTIKIKVENKNEKRIEGFIVRLYGSNGTFTNDSIDIALEPFEIKYIIVGYDSSIGNITKIEVIPKIIVDQKEIAATLQSDEFLAPAITGAVSGELTADANTVLLFHFDKDSSEEGEAKEYTSDPNMVAWYHFNGDTSDSSGNGNTGTINGATYTTPGKFNGAYNFDGINDYINITNTNAGNLNSDEDFTLEAWIKPTYATTGAIISNEEVKESGYNLIFTSNQNIAFVVGGTVMDGLFIELDASNTKSYPETGTTWYDISGDGNNFAGTNMDENDFANTYPQSFDFNANDEEFSKAADGRYNNQYDFTWEAWVNPNSISSGAAFARQALKDDYMGFGSSQVYVRRYQTNPASGGSPQIGIWQQIVGKGDSTNLYVYLNDAEVDSSSNTQQFSATHLKWFVGCQHHAYATVSTGFNGNISLVRAYTSTLSDEEINQNFESVAYRFGLTNDATTTDTINLNEYSHIVATKSGNICSIYINGILSKSFSCNISQDLVGQLFIGARASGVREYFNGAIDEVAIYNKALSATEIVQHAGILAKDYSSYSNNGIISGANWTSSGKFGSALEFDGVNNYINCGNDASLAMGTNNMTISAWIKTTQSTEGQIVRSDRNVPFYIFGIDNNKLRAQISDGSNNVDDHNENGPTVNDGEWHHVAVVFDRTSNIVFYKDGIATEGKDISSVTGDVSAPADYLAIGKRPGQDQQFFEGIIDEIRISDIARTF